jgi:hypothetical protein
VPHAPIFVDGVIVAYNRADAERDPIRAGRRCRFALDEAAGKRCKGQEACNRFDAMTTPQWRYCWEVTVGVLSYNCLSSNLSLDKFDIFMILAKVRDRLTRHACAVYD